jgi:hypothetical protein
MDPATAAQADRAATILNKMQDKFISDLGNSLKDSLLDSAAAEVKNGACDFGDICLMADIPRGTSPPDPINLPENQPLRMGRDLTTVT